MRALVAIDHHFFRTRDGAVLLGPPMSIPGYQFWKRYLSVFEEVVVLGRVRPVDQVMNSSLRADGPGVVFHDLPDYLGPWEYLAQFRRLRAEVEKAVDLCDAFILRIPGAIGQLAWKYIRKRGRPFALEVVADPWDILSPGATRSIVRPVVRRIWSSHLRQMCAEASALCYVTREALQRRYPAGPSSWATHASDVELSGAIAEQSQLDKRIDRLKDHFSENGSKPQPLRLGFLGALAQTYKAPDVLLRAMAICQHNGLNFEVAIAGDGKFRCLLEKLATDIGIRNRVCFHGALTPGSSVFEFLDQIDLFVLPSRQEGLPRALVEAMARGCPCIATAVGGVPELLPPGDLVRPGDVNQLAAKIREVICDLPRLEHMSQRNWAIAQEYRSSILVERRLAFYSAVRDRAEERISRFETA